MANKRMVASNIWRDDFVSTLDYFKRLLWIGMVVTCADDQGRFQNRAGFIAADVFPGEMVDHRLIEDAINEFVAQNKIFQYSDGKTQLLQVVNWWSYQSPQWATVSKYAAPEGWTDRVRMHVKDNKVFTQNWDHNGGFQNNIPPSLPTQVPTPLNSRVPYPLEDGERREAGEGVGEEGTNCDSPSEIQLVLEKITGLPPTNAGDIQAMHEIEVMHPLQTDIQDAFDWVISQGKRVLRYSSLVGPVRTAIAKRAQKPPGKAESIQEHNLRVVAEILQEVNNGNT